MTVPYDHGLLDVDDVQHVYWECCGNPDGTPVLMVHGGPGSGCSPSMRNVVDLARHRLILFDQRGCGRSRPHAADPTTDLTANTTQHLVADMERLRQHLGVTRWLLTGGSWGSTLILAYAQRHPGRVSGVVIRGVTTTSRRELRWPYLGRRTIFPRRAGALPGPRPRGGPRPVRRPGRAGRLRPTLLLPRPRRPRARRHGMVHLGGRVDRPRDHRTARRLRESATR